MMRNPMVSHLKMTTSRISELMAAQANSRVGLKFTGYDRAVVLQQRARRAEEIRSTFTVLQGGADCAV